MADNYEALVPAELHEDAHGIPFSAQYRDVYHGAAGALPQALHVFLRGNGLPARWRGHPAFTICETGFGLGHNFLATWHSWQEDPARCSRLHYVAFEARPFAQADLLRVWRRLPESFWPLARALADEWPALLPGLHRLELAGGCVTLTLAFGRIERLARQVQARVDAFFLDGFAPRTNPEMWSPHVFGQLRRLAREGATAATWCAAGQMRRDLRDAGFLVSRAPGFAAKRDMTVAVLRPGLGAPRGRAVAQRIAIVGGGLAGAAVAQSLALRGDEVDLWDPQDVPQPRPAWHAGGGAALIPPLTADDDTRARLGRAGLERAWARWMALGPQARPEACGALVCARDAAEGAYQQHLLARLQFPSGWVCGLDSAAAARRAGVSVPWGGLWVARALRVCLPALVAELRSLPGVRRCRGRVAGLRRTADGAWNLLAADGRVLGAAGQVVLAAARQVPALVAPFAGAHAWPVLMGLMPVAGQVSLYVVRDEEARVPRCILSGRGYCLPPHAGWGLAGSTYRPRAADCAADAAGHRAILAGLHTWLVPGGVPWLGRGTPQAWSGWRATTRDHLPVVGPVPGQAGLWVACAYGSRGLSWAALAGDLLAAQLHDEPLPVERELVHRIRLR